MEPGIYNPKIYRGTDFSLSIEVPVALNLSGMTCIAAIRASWDPTIEATLTTSFTLPGQTGQQITFTIPKAVTAELPSLDFRDPVASDTYFWDAALVDSLGKTHPFLRGFATVLPTAIQ